MNILTFPNKKMDFAFAIDGWWKPDRLQIDESLLAYEMLSRIKKDIVGSDYTEFDTEWHIDKKPFEFLCVVNYEHHDLEIEIQDINIHCYWNGADLPVNCMKEVVRTLIESHILI